MSRETDGLSPLECSRTEEFGESSVAKVSEVDGASAADNKLLSDNTVVHDFEAEFTMHSASEELGEPSGVKEENSEKIPTDDQAAAKLNGDGIAQDTSSDPVQSQTLAEEIDYFADIMSDSDKANGVEESSIQAHSIGFVSPQGEESFDSSAEQNLGPEDPFEVLPGNTAVGSGSVSFSNEIPSNEPSSPTLANFHDADDIDITDTNPSVINAPHDGSPQNFTVDQTGLETNDEQSMAVATGQKGSVSALALDSIKNQQDSVECREDATTGDLSQSSVLDMTETSSFGGDPYPASDNNSGNSPGAEQQETTDIVNSENSISLVEKSEAQGDALENLEDNLPVENHPSDSRSISNISHRGVLNTEDPGLSSAIDDDDDDDDENSLRVEASGDNSGECVDSQAEQEIVDVPIKGSSSAIGQGVFASIETVQHLPPEHADTSKMVLNTPQRNEAGYTDVSTTVIVGSELHSQDELSRDQATFDPSNPQVVEDSASDKSDEFGDFNETSQDANPISTINTDINHCAVDDNPTPGTDASVQDISSTVVEPAIDAGDMALQTSDASVQDISSTVVEPAIDAGDMALQTSDASVQDISSTVVEPAIDAGDMALQTSDASVQDISSTIVEPAMDAGDMALQTSDASVQDISSTIVEPAMDAGDMALQTSDASVQDISSTIVEPAMDAGDMALQTSDASVQDISSTIVEPATDVEDEISSAGDVAAQGITVNAGELATDVIMSSSLSKSEEQEPNLERNTDRNALIDMEVDSLNPTSQGVVDTLDQDLHDNFDSKSQTPNLSRDLDDPDDRPLNLTSEETLEEARVFSNGEKDEEFGDFGDFEDHQVTSPETVPIIDSATGATDEEPLETGQKGLHKTNDEDLEGLGDDDFGDFGEADFGDFDEAPKTVDESMAAIANPKTIPETSDGNDDIGDEFGDFGDADFEAEFQEAELPSSSPPPNSSTGDRALEFLSMPLDAFQDTVNKVFGSISQNTAVLKDTVIDSSSRDDLIKSLIEDPASDSFFGPSKCTSCGALLRYISSKCLVCGEEVQNTGTMSYEDLCVNRAVESLSKYAQVERAAVHSNELLKMLRSSDDEGAAILLGRSFANLQVARSPRTSIDSRGTVLNTDEDEMPENKELPHDTERNPDRTDSLIFEDSNILLRSDSEVEAEDTANPHVAVDADAAFEKFKAQDFTSQETIHTDAELEHTQDEEETEYSQHTMSDADDMSTNPDQDRQGNTKGAEFDDDDDDFGVFEKAGSTPPVTSTSSSIPLAPTPMSAANDAVNESSLIAPAIPSSSHHNMMSSDDILGFDDFTSFSSSAPPTNTVQDQGFASSDFFETMSSVPGSQQQQSPLVSGTQDQFNRAQAPTTGELSSDGEALLRKLWQEQNPDVQDAGLPDLSFIRSEGLALPFNATQLASRRSPSPALESMNSTMPSTPTSTLEQLSSQNPTPPLDTQSAAQVEDDDPFAGL